MASSGIVYIVIVIVVIIIMVFATVFNESTDNTRIIIAAIISISIILFVTIPIVILHMILNILFINAASS